MAWCCQAVSHYLNQCWFTYVMPYGITRPWWVDIRQHCFLDIWCSKQWYSGCLLKSLCPFYHVYAMLSFSWVPGFNFINEYSSWLCYLIQALLRCIHKWGKISQSNWKHSLPSVYGKVLTFNSLAPGRCACNLKILSVIFELQSRILVRWPSGDCHKTSLTLSQHWFR